MIKMRLNKSEQARLRALAQIYDYPETHAGFCATIRQALIEATAHHPFRRCPTPRPASEKLPTYLNYHEEGTADLIADLRRRTGLASEPIKDVLFFAVGTILYRGELMDDDETMTILAQLESGRTICPDANAD